MLNWRDISDKATAFAHEWKDTKQEDSWAKAFWVRFFDIFGVRERSIGMFEKRVKLLGTKALKSRDGKIDFFAPNTFLVEHKSAGKSLDAAFTQASDYFDALSEEQKPRYIIVSDFARFRIYDLEGKEDQKEFEFPLEDLPKHVAKFSFLTTEEVRVYKEEDPINVRAVRAIGKLHDALTQNNYPPTKLAPLLTRLVFCFFADDTGIFNRNSLRRYFDEVTKPDGSDIGAHLNAIFQVLDTPEDKRQSTMDDILSALPYVNGGLFSEPLPVVFGSRSIRDMLVACSSFDWSGISPAVFGSMFQSVLDEKERHDLGAHYTSEENILKVIDGLFMDDLRNQLKLAGSNHEKLDELWNKLEKITLLDPACGCGNFLVIAYRELRRLELEVIKRRYKQDVKKIESGDALLPLEVDLSKLSRLSVERMFGIEIESFPAEVAKLSLWLMDHIMNTELGTYFGKPFRKLPLREQPHIVEGNALIIDWQSVVPREKLTYILGNPPFLGKHIQSKIQKAELMNVFGGAKNASDLDFVAAWYRKAAEYIQKTRIRCAFVSTNSITQGEQASILWPVLFSWKIKISFAHRTFNWTNEAKGKAAVYCVIIGFGLDEPQHPLLFFYDDIKGDSRRVEVNRINPYLVDGPDIVITKRRKPLADVPEMQYGNKPSDSGLLILSDLEKDKLIKDEPRSEKWIRKYIGAEEYINGGNRWCLWLVDVKPEELRSMPIVMRRVEAVRTFRNLSTAAPTRAAASTPWLFFYVSQPSADYILIPETSSENRDYIPIGYVSKDVISSNATYHIAQPNLYIFGIIQSTMHMTWMRAVAGRLKSDYRYSGSLVYNTFPWPHKPGVEQINAVEDAAQNVLNTRAKYLNATLADLYDRKSMPLDLQKAHQVLDRSVDNCYAQNTFKSEPARLKFLFELYSKLTA